MKSRWLSSLISSFATTNSYARLERRNISLVLNHVEISLMLSNCGRERNFYLGTSLHAVLLKQYEHFSLQNPENLHNILAVWNSLLYMYLGCGELSSAANVFDHMPVKDTISWNSMISGIIKTRSISLGICFYKQMQNLGIYPADQATLTTMVSACDRQELAYICKMIHGLVFLNGYEQELTVGNSLITAYYRCGCFDFGRRVFDEMLEKNVITWTAIISGLAQNQFYEDSLKLFVRMRSGSVSLNVLTYLTLLSACAGQQAIREGRQIHGLVWKLGFQSDFCIESALMDMYSKCDCMDDVVKILESAEVLDEVSLTVVLAGFAQNGLEEEAIQIFVKIVKMGIEIDPNMVSSILGVFSVKTSLSLGEQIHSLIIKQRFTSNPFVNNGLINMYSKCGELNESVKVFNRMPQKNSVSWNSMIAAFARHGNGYKALQLYEEMKKEGMEPTDITFLSLLHACSHVGLIDEGIKFIESMVKVYGINPRPEHYACIIDMLGRKGLLKEARSFIERLSVKPDILIWQALIGACSIRGESETGKYAADQLISTAPENPTPYILMANIYSSEGKWKERAKTIKRMKEVGVTKGTGISWIEIEKRVHSFVVEDRMHPQAEIIYGVLRELFWQMRDEGYVPDRRFLLYRLSYNERV